MTPESTTQSPSLFSMARSKLQSAVGSSVKDSCSLHRWVLLKNSIIRSHPSDVATATPDKADVPYVYRRSEDEGRGEAEEVAFLFPDPGKLPDCRKSDVGASENEWLNSLLETLGDEDEDLPSEDAEGGVPGSPPDEDDEPLSPLYSPMSSSDDLVGQSSYYCDPHAIPIPYPIPYPPVHDSPIPTWFDFDSPADSFVEVRPQLYHDPLPYYAVDDDTEDLPVPDAIEDLSDDESDVPSTPFDHSTSSLLTTDPAFIPLPPERRRRSHSLHPQVYIDTDDSHFYRYEVDPLPFHDDDSVDTARVFRPSLYQEC